MNAPKACSHLFTVAAGALLLHAAPLLAAENWRLAAPVYRALANFNSEPAGSCESNGLRAAVENAHRLEGELVTIEERAFAAGAVLDVADAAAIRSCPDIARTLYEGVLAAYAPADFPAVRARAENALEALPQASGP